MREGEIQAIFKSPARHVSVYRESKRKAVEQEINLWVFGDS